MSRKKEAALQDIITSEQEWDQYVANVEGLITVVDAYPKWTGPCKSIQSTLKRIKLEQASQILRFATACIDDIEALTEYRNQPPEPMFLIYASGILVDICHGCDVPLLTKKVKAQNENEEKIAAGMAAERVPYQKVVEEARTSTSRQSIRSTVSAAGLSEDVATAEVGSDGAKQLCFAFVTPQYIENAEDIKDMLIAAGIDILADRQHQLTVEDMQEVYPDATEQASGAAFIEYVVSNQSHLLILTRTGETGIGIIDQMMTLVGPGDQEQAKTEAPDSINAKYGNMTMFTSADTNMSTRAINLLFEDFEAPAISRRASQIGMVSNDIKYLIFGPCSEDFQTQVQNYGCQIVEAASGEISDEEKQLIPEEYTEFASQRMLVTSARSLSTLQNFCESIGDEGVFIAKA